MNFDQLVFSKMQIAVDNSPLVKFANKFCAPQVPSFCYGGFHKARHGPGGTKLTRIRLIRKWMKIRPASSFPAWRLTRKVCNEHKRIFWMYYNAPDKGVEVQQ